MQGLSQSLNNVRNLYQKFILKHYDKILKIKFLKSDNLLDSIFQNKYKL
jgi:hypothetical protein